MEWLALTTWIIVFLLVLPLGAGALCGRISLGLQAAAAAAGLALIIVYLSVGEAQSLVWVAAGVALIGILAVSVSAAGLVSGRVSTVSAAPAIQEREAGLAGVQLPFFVVTLILTMTGWPGDRDVLPAGVLECP